MQKIEPDIRAIAQSVQKTVDAAGLSDFKVEFGEEGKPHRLRCSVDGSNVEISYRSEKFGDDLMKIEQIQVVNGSGRPEVYVADNEAKEMHAQRVGVPVVSRFRELSRTAGSKGVAFVRNAFKADPEVDLSKAHLTDIEITVTEDGKRQVKGNLTLEDVTLKPPKSIGINLVDPGAVGIDQSAKNEPEGPTQKPEIITLEFKLTEQEASESGVCPLERSVEVLCSTQDGYGMSSRCSGAQILLAAMHANPELAEVQAIPLNELVDRIREGSTDTEPRAQLQALQTALRNRVLFHFTDAELIDRGSFSEGDLILHAQPALNPGISLQVYRVKELETVPEDQQGVTKVQMKITSLDGEEKVSQVKLPQHEAYFRRVMGTELPAGGSGLMNFHMDHDLTLKTPRIRRWGELTDFTRDVGIKANATPDMNDFEASVRDGVLSWAVIVRDPLALAILSDMDDDTPVAIFPDDDRNISVVCRKTEGSLERRLEGVPPGEFRVPGYWRASPDIVDLLIRYQQALANCSDADVVALGVAGEI